MADPYITYPTAQNADITFPVAPIVPTLPGGTNTTQAASTGFVQNATTALLSSTNTWSGLQTFNNGVASNTINPTAGGTLTIGNAAATTNVEIATSVGRSTILHLGDGNNTTGAIHIGNGLNTSGNVNILNGSGSTGTINLGSSTSTTSLGCPLTPAYTYPIASGKIGQVVTGTNATTLTITANTALTVSTITGLTAGTWLFFGQTGRGSGTGYLTIALNQTTNSLTGAILVDTDATTNTGPQQTFTTIVQANTSPYYLIAQSDVTGTFSAVVFTAVRIA